MKNLFNAFQVILLVVISLSITTVNAQEIDENNGWNTAFIATVGENGSTFYAQSFIANVDVITRFGVVIKEGEAEGQVRLAIATDNGLGTPNVTTPLYQGAIINPTGTGIWYYEAGLTIKVTPGQKYWVLIDGYANAGATGHSEIGISDNRPDTGEGMIYSNNAGSSWGMVFAMPLAIRVEGIKPATVDENTSWNTNFIANVGEGGTDFYAQSFYADVDLITRFGVVIKETGAEGQVRLAIATDNGTGVPDVSAPLYQGELINPSPIGSWYYEKGLGIPVTIGQKYWVLIDGYTNAGATGYSEIGVSDNYTDTGEGMIYSNSGGLGSWISVYSKPIAVNVEGIKKTIIDENNGYNGNVINAIGTDGSDYYAQSFYATIDAITNFGAYVKETAPEGEVTFAIAANNGSGFPNIATPLYQGTLLNPPTSGAWFYSKGINVPVTVGAKYWVVIRGCQNTGATGTSGVGLSSSYTDTGEPMIFSNEGGVGSWLYSTFPIAIFVDGSLSQLAVSDTIVGGEETTCFDATGNISVAGSSSVEFLNGSSVDLIAGNSIALLPGFHAYEGSLVHAFISTDGEYCSFALSSPVYSDLYKSTVLSTAVEESKAPDVVKGSGLRVYPNPTTGIFTVEMTNLVDRGDITISNILGEVVLQHHYNNTEGTRIDLSRFEKGIYFLQVNDGKSIASQKILKN